MDIHNTHNINDANDADNINDANDMKDRDTLDSKTHSTYCATTIKELSDTDYEKIIKRSNVVSFVLSDILDPLQSKSDGKDDAPLRKDDQNMQIDYTKAIEELKKSDIFVRDLINVSIEYLIGGIEPKDIKGRIKDVKVLVATYNFCFKHDCIGLKEIQEVLVDKVLNFEDSKFIIENVYQVLREHLQTIMSVSNYRYISTGVDTMSVPKDAIASPKFFDYICKRDNIKVDFSSLVNDGKWRRMERIEKWRRMERRWKGKY